MAQVRNVVRNAQCVHVVAPTGASTCAASLQSTATPTPNTCPHRKQLSGVTRVHTANISVEDEDVSSPKLPASSGLLLAVVMAVTGCGDGRHWD